MRIAKIIGQVTLSRWHGSVAGVQWKLAVPMTEEDLCNHNKISQAEELVVYDELSATEGHLIALSEGAEASMPFYPKNKPVDAYNAAILDKIEIFKRT